MKEIYEVSEIKNHHGKEYSVSVGDTIHYLTITKLYSNHTCDCICKCGKEKKNIKITSILSGNTTSCGCRNKELTSERNYIHCDSKTRLYKIWQGMKKRCLNKNNARYKEYGGRGISICDEWLLWVNFKDWALKNGYNDTLTIERKDYDKNYEPCNCTWIPICDQSKNRSSCNWITFNGETHTLTEWAKIKGIKRSTLSSRILTRGWSIEKALTTP